MSLIVNIFPVCVHTLSFMSASFSPYYFLQFAMKLYYNKCLQYSNMSKSSYCIRETDARPEGC